MLFYQEFKMVHTKSQSSAEFVLLVAFVLFGFTLFLLAVQEANSDKIHERKDLFVKEIAFTVQDEINLAFKSIDGYQREFVLPASLNGLDYDIQLVENMVYVKTEDDKHAVALPIKNVTGNIFKGNNLIRKFEGEVRINV